MDEFAAISGVSGILVQRQDEASFARAVESALGTRFDPVAIRRNAERFSAQRFGREFLDWVAQASAARGISLTGPALDPAMPA